MHSPARFDNIHPGLTCDHARHLLMKPIKEQDSESDFYTAAAHLINCPCVETTNVLITFLKSSGSSCQAVKIAKRKVVEVLARLGSKESIAVIGNCLWSDDNYLVENSVWALQVLGCDDNIFIDKMIELLEHDTTNQRIIIQSLACLNIEKSLAIISSFQTHSIPGVQGAAISAVAKLTKDFSRVSEITQTLLSPNQMNRHCAIQDLIDANAINQLGEIISAPVSPVFKTRALRQMYDNNPAQKIDRRILTYLDSVISCDLSVINLIHQYDSTPSADFLIRELYNTDFGRCYLALKNIPLCSATEIFPLIKESWLEEAHNDYGAHFFFTCLFGTFSNWPETSYSWIFEVLISSIFNLRPQFQKSRAAAIVSLSKLNPQLVCELIPEILTNRDQLPWEMRYSLIQCFDNYISGDKVFKDDIILKISDNDLDVFVQARARKVLT